MDIDLEGYKRQERRISNTLLRQQRFKEDPHCYWCGIETKLHMDICKRGLRKFEGFPANMATIEHLYDRLDPRRYHDYHNKKKVLACYGCNTRRAAKRNKQAKEILEERQRLAKQRSENKDTTPRPFLYPFFQPATDTD